MRARSLVCPARCEFGQTFLPTPLLGSSRGFLKSNWTKPALASPISFVQKSHRWHWPPWALTLAVLSLVRDGPQAHDLQIDFEKTNGVIRALHGVNSGPLCYRGTVDLSKFHRELGIPLTRLHDVVWLNAEAVDIHTIFPDFRNDPERPDSYAFQATDDYIQAIINVGSRIVYRLGESIEHTPHKYQVHPPPDPRKWAAICLGIIRHYNEGWAGGYHHNIRYWEIWNEPDVRPAMWTGNDEQYFQLYETAAKAIKARFPDLKVGGPALGGVGDFKGDAFRPAGFLTNFLAFCAERRVPLDFFSWHHYTSQPWDLPRRARAVRRILDQAGFANAESHLNEWNFLPDDDWRPMLRDGQGAEREQWYRKMGGPAGAAFAACALMLLQDAPLNEANFYTGEIQGFGMFDINGVPKTTFYAFKAFRELLGAPLRVETLGARNGEVAALSGTNLDRTQAALLVSNFKSSDSQFRLSLRHQPWQGRTSFELFLVDGQHHLSPMGNAAAEPNGAAVSFELKAPSVLLVKLRPQTEAAPK